MCGICGILYTDRSRRVELTLLERMCDAMRHRGPDGDGYYIHGAVGLGMRRLSIIDLAGGKQPIHNEASNVHVVFNGEIYNYRELRSTLEECGHFFYTQSDTEVIVHAYEEYGDSCLGHFRGMFGLALWDENQQTLLLALDRFGIKPLYYAATENGLAFASELKCLVSAGIRPREIDFGALAQYFTLGYIPAPATILTAVRKLPPGGYLRWGPNRGSDVGQYWDLSTIQPERRPLKDVHHQLHNALRDAVRSHLVSDVPLGAFLSGGVDSSTVVALMSEITAEPIKTFSIGFADKQHDERSYARLVAERFHTEHHELVVEPEAVDLLPSLVTQFDEPFSDSSALPTYYVSKLARRFVKVALSGDGGDELFLGYRLFQGVELARHMQLLPASLRRGLASLAGALPPTGNPVWNDRMALFGKRVSDSLLAPDESYRSKITVGGLATVWPLLSGDLRHHLEGQNPYSAVDEYLAKGRLASGRHPLDRFVQAGLKVSLAGDMLVKVDRMSMMNSLEVRVPLLDHLLAEFVASIPLEQRFPRLRLKGLLKDVMSDTLPSQIINHPKHGFTVPLSAWFRGDLNAFASDVLLDGAARGQAHLDSAAIEKLLKRHQQGADNFGSAIWSLLVFELWRRQVV